MRRATVDGFLGLNQTLQILALRSSGWRSLQQQQQLVRSIRFGFVTGSEQQGSSSSSPVIRSLPDFIHVRIQQLFIGDGCTKLYELSIVPPPPFLCPAQKVIEGGYLRRGRCQSVTSGVDSSSNLIQSPSKSCYYPTDGWTGNIWLSVDAARLRWTISLFKSPSIARLAQLAIDG